MPFCTACGKQNPDDARFCAQCGTKLLAGEDTGASPVESTATITFGVPDQRESSDRQLSPVDAAAVDALHEGHALLVVQRGPSAGGRAHQRRQVLHRVEPGDAHHDELALGHAELRSRRRPCRLGRRLA